ncbi:tripartite tricarboxylate transporter substrate binding protein [Allopusillimonas soli]|uniref:Tripartite tricarboxylate transporter substrate binding protein n=1 Tax=Allopusillimonas soli TaxID=659016 RepID=A0A853F8X4_9BURK|nr:tripartite tricarboxylate transporter substrate binding protein [Allopusillimonas soli]NYT36399.1 tripartite tricarboxylate transporter substrate binding protein [Allopusillimonas soli]TEA74912.1 tripartite tricarboxylate transporter substrate binding protein [Allopusillimonas soli]
MCKKLIKAAAFAGSLMLMHFGAAAQGYPSAPITLVVPYVAGASTDALARLVGQSVSEQLGQPVVVENRSGAGGMIAADHVMQQPSDGYTFMLTTDGILSVNPVIYKKVAYDSLKDFQPLSIAVNAPLVLVVKSDSPFKSVEDVIKAAKSKPGTLTFGSAGVGTSQHMAGEMFNQKAAVDINHVPYRGGAPAMNDLLGGHIDMMFVQSASAVELAKAGKIRILGIGSPERSPALPEVPTFDELGLKGYDSDTWYGFDMPAGASEVVVSKLHAAIVKALKDEKSRLEAEGYVVVASTPQEMHDSIKRNIEKWGELAKLADIYKSK